MKGRERIHSIDALRGFSIILMVIYHFLYDLVNFLDVPSWIFSNLVFDFLQPVFGGIFIILSGVSSKFSRSNTLRGIRVLAIAVAITLVTWAMDNIILFGVLHLLGVCMLFYGITGRLWDKIPEKIAPWIFIALTVGAYLAARSANPTDTNTFFVLGFHSRSFFSADYYPILPWIFVFLFGTWLGRPVIERRLPNWVYTANPPILPAIGRKSLAIYVVHQPVIYALTMLIGKVTGRI